MLLKLISTSLFLWTKYRNSDVYVRKLHMYFNAILMLLLLLSFGLSLKKNKQILRTAGARNATNDEYPYVIKIAILTSNDVESSIVFCSGSVLVSKWTLTAAHCIRSLERRLWKSETIEKKGVIIYQPSASVKIASSDILSTAICTNYFDKKANDIGLIRTQPLILKSYGKLSSVDYSTLNGQQIALVGYGLFRNKEEKRPDHLQGLDAIVMECPNRYYYPGLCFAPPCSTNLEATCTGNSGGPTIHSSGIVGINVKGISHNCQGNKKIKSRTNNPHSIVTIAVAVSPFIDWISRTITTETE